MNLYIVRHGQTNWNKENRLQGLTDIPLNDNGIEQAYKTQKLLSNIKFDLAFCSPLKRTIQTAEIILQDKITYQLDNRLIERSFGNLEGKYGKDINILPYWDLEKNLSSQNVENINDFFSKIYSFLKDVYSLYNDTNKNILIVTHNGVAIAIDAILNNIQKDLLSLNIKPCEYKYFENIRLPGGKYE